MPPATGDISCSYVKCPNPHQRIQISAYTLTEKPLPPMSSMSDCSSLLAVATAPQARSLSNTTWSAWTSACKPAEAVKHQAISIGLAISS